MQVDAVMRLRQAGGTVAFITRYRQDQTDGLDEDQGSKFVFFTSLYILVLLTVIFYRHHFGFLLLVPHFI